MGQKSCVVSGKRDRNVVGSLEITCGEAWDGAGSALQSPYLCYGWKITILNTLFFVYFVSPASFPRSAAAEGEAT